MQNQFEPTRFSSIRAEEFRTYSNMMICPHYGEVIIQVGQPNEEGKFVVLFGMVSTPDQESFSMLKLAQDNAKRKISQQIHNMLKTNIPSSLSFKQKAVSLLSSLASNFTYSGNSIEQNIAENYRDCFNDIANALMEVPFDEREAKIFAQQKMKNFIK